MKISFLGFKGCFKAYVCSYHAINGFYHTNYGVIQGFPALRKVVTTHVKNTTFFHVCLISPISCWHVTRLSRHSVRLMNERQSLHHSQSKVVCQNIFGLCLLKDRNIRIDAYRQCRSNFLEREENQNTKWKTETHVFSGFGNGISRGWERKSTTGRFATGRFWPGTWMISSVGKDQFDNWEFCILKIRPIVCFCSDTTHVFILNAPMHFTICIRGLSILIFSFINRVDFSCQ